MCESFRSRTRIEGTNASREAKALEAPLRLRGFPGRAGRYGSCIAQRALISGVKARRWSRALRLIAAAAVVAGAAHAQPTRAFDDRARARVLADEAANAFARGNFARAELLLEHAYSIMPAPTVALLRARSLVRLGRWVDALQVYRMAAGAKLEASSPQVFQRASEAAKTELALLEPRVPELRIDIAEPLRSAPSLRVSVDGRSIPKSQLGSWLLFDPRQHSLTVEVEGRKVRSLLVTLRERDRIAVPVDAPSERSDATRTWGIVSLAAGGAALAFGVVTGDIALDAHSEANRHCPNGVCASQGAGADAVDRFETYRTLSTIGYVAGAAGISVGAYLLITAPRSETPVAISTSLDGVRVRGAW